MRRVLMELADRCEVATGAETAALLLEGFRAAHGEKPPRVVGGSEEWIDWLTIYNPFFRLVEAGGYLDAAMTLAPEGWDWMVRGPCKDATHDPAKSFAHISSADFETATWGKGEDWITDVLAGKDAKAIAATPALALCAASLRARAAQCSDAS